MPVVLRLELIITHLEKQIGENRIEQSNRIDPMQAYYDGKADALEQTVLYIAKTIREIEKA